MSSHDDTVSEYLATSVNEDTVTKLVRRHGDVDATIGHLSARHGRGLLTDNEFSAFMIRLLERV